jgi:hypothetical protein
MSENEEQSDIAIEPGTDIQVIPDKSFTLSEDRLAGSPSCLNCGTELKGPFCYYCGQPDRNFMRFFPALLRELMSDFLEFDSRFVRTMKPLLFRPGKLTRDYLEGRRFRYTPPLRLYLFSSIAFFLFAAVLSNNAISTSASHRAEGEGVISVTPDNVENLEQAQQALDQVPAEIREELRLDRQIQNAIDRAEDQANSEEETRLDIDDESDDEKPDENIFSPGQISFNDEPWDRETNPVDIKWLPAWLNDWINDEVEASPEKAERINENPNLIVEQVFDILPATMFILLPLVAMIFKFWYLFAKRFYVEHLIFSLHNHSFLFVSLMLILILSIAEGLLKDGGAMFAAKVSGGLLIALWVWIPLYLFISLRHVYRQNWFLTLGKFAVIGISYVTLLGLTTSVVAILSFVLMD